MGGARGTGPGRAAYQALCAKDGLEATGALAGVLTPGGVVVHGAMDGSLLPAAPCVVKPVTSATPTTAGVRYRAAALAPDAPTRDRLVREMAADTGSVIVQPFVTGRRWRLHFARSGAGFAATAMRTVTSSPRSTGMSSVTHMARVPAAMGLAASRLVAAAGYRGVGAVQFIESPAGFVAHDVNLRTEYSLGVDIGSGLDVPALAVAIALGDPVDIGRVRPVRYVWLAGELRGIGEDLRAGQGRAALRGAGEILGAAVLPGRVLDPSDPRALIDELRGFARRRSEPPPAV